MAIRINTKSRQIRRSRTGTQTHKAELATIKAEIYKPSQQQMINIVLSILNTLRGEPPEGTPVDTGWATSNWLVSIGEPLKGTVEPYSEAIYQAGIVDIFNYDIKKDGEVFIVNNVPYIQFLNQGTSQQSPAGFVEKAIRKALREAKKRGRVISSKYSRGKKKVKK
jgi:hypothetical protein